MTTENNSSLEENQETGESLQISSDHKQCTHDGDCPSGERCVNGECTSGS